MEKGRKGPKGRKGSERYEAGDCKASTFAKVTVGSRTAPGDEPAFAKATAGKHIRAHAQELITFSPRQKTDWGKKRVFSEDSFERQGMARAQRTQRWPAGLRNPRSTGLPTRMRRFGWCPRTSRRL